MRGYVIILATIDQETLRRYVILLATMETEADEEVCNKTSYYWIFDHTTELLQTTKQ